MLKKKFIFEKKTFRNFEEKQSTGSSLKKSAHSVQPFCGQREHIYECIVLLYR